MIGGLVAMTLDRSILRQLGAGRRTVLVTGTNGVVVAQGGRFGGWSLYVVGGVPHYAYNHVGRALTVVRGGKPMVPGRHDLVVRFAYDGGPPGSGAETSSPSSSSTRTSPQRPTSSGVPSGHRLTSTSAT